MQHTIEYMSEHVYPYPWPHMSACEGIIGGGMEYPMMTLCGPRAASTTRHETIHMWFPMIVGSNEKRYAWQDEGFTSFWTTLCGDDFDGRKNGPMRDVMGYANTVKNGGDVVCMRHADTYGADDFQFASYTKTAAILHQLRGLLGDETFFAAFRRYVNDWAMKHPAPYDVFATFQDVAGIDEGAPVATMPDPENERVMEFYGALKALCEQAAEAIMPGRVTNVRPGYIVGPLDPTDRFTYWPVRIARGGDVIAPGTPADPVQFIDARDLATWIIGAIEQRHVGVYNLVGPREPTTAGDFLQQCIEVSGSDAKLTWVDHAFLEQQKVEIGADLPICVPPVGDFLGFAQVSNAKAIATGLTTRPARETIADTLAWFETLPEPRRKTLHAGWLPQREAEVLAAYRARDSSGAKSKRKRAA